MQLIEQWLSVDFSQPMELIIAFVVVMVLIALVTLIVRGITMRSGDGFRGRAQKRQRLFVGEWVRVDEKRRLLLVRRDDVEHLLLIGGNSDLVVEQDVTSRKPQVVPVAASQIATQPDVYTPPEKPRIPTSDPGYRSPLRIPATNTVTASSAPLVADGVAAMDAPMDEVANDATKAPGNGTYPDTKLTGLQAAHARIAALRRKSAKISKPGAAGAAVAAEDIGKAEAAGDMPEEPKILTVAAIDPDDAVAEEISVDQGAAEDTNGSADNAPHIDAETDDTAKDAAALEENDGEVTEDLREDDLAARLHDVLIKPA